MEKYPHYLERLQAATRKYWDKVLGQTRIEQHRW